MLLVCHPLVAVHGKGMAILACRGVWECRGLEKSGKQQSTKGVGRGVSIGKVKVLI